MCNLVYRHRLSGCMLQHRKRKSIRILSFGVQFSCTGTQFFFVFIHSQKLSILLLRCDIFFSLSLYRLQTSLAWCLYRYSFVRLLLADIILLNANNSIFNLHGTHRLHCCGAHHAGIVSFESSRSRKKRINE